MRKSRVLKKGARYHVSVRVNNKEMLLDSYQAKILFRSTVIRAKKKFSFSIDNYVIMGNHVHFIIAPGEDENLSKIMQWMLSVFALRFNKCFNRSGHFWGERFFSRIIESFYDYLRTYTYIDNNPYAAGLASKNDTLEFSGAYELKTGNRRLITCFSPTLLQLFLKYDELLIS